jgi:hypothetical protein
MKLIKIIHFCDFLWELPQNLIGSLLLLKKHKLVGRIGQIRLYQTKLRGSVSLGKFVFLCPNHANNKQIMAHEVGHCAQSQQLGWLYLIVVGLPSLLNAVIRFTKNYSDFYTEK